MRAARTTGADDRIKEIRRKEFEIITKFGARNTRSDDIIFCLHAPIVVHLSNLLCRWETVFDSTLNRNVIINIDTLRVMLSFDFYL